MSSKGSGYIGTIIFHAIILALLLFRGLNYPDPPPEEEGILVNFGIDETGFGDVEPIGDEYNAATPEPEVTQDTEESVPEPVVESSSNEVFEVDNTQDVEEVIVKEDPKPTAEEIRKQQEAERIRQEKIEADKIEKERLEAERVQREKEEAEQRERDAKANRISNRGKNTFGRQGVGETTGSEGVNPGTGTNQGSTTGTPGASNYGDGAGLGNGRIQGLGSRTVAGTLPEPKVTSTITQKLEIIVTIKVDRNGHVVSATITKSDYSQKDINDAVLAAARATKFSKDPDGQYMQQGTIKYTIEPQ